VLRGGFKERSARLAASAPSLWRPWERGKTSRAARVEGGELPQSGWPLVHIARRLADLIALCDAADADHLVRSGEVSLSHEGALMKLCRPHL
jgi:hypothetical protein